jgi:hypothetical protein
MALKEGDKQMQNMIQLRSSNGNINVFFSVDEKTKDFSEVLVKDIGGKVVSYNSDEIEIIKDAIAIEVQLSYLEMTNILKSGLKPTLH